MSTLLFDGEEPAPEIVYDEKDLSHFDYQCIVDALLKTGDQLNEQSLRFLKGKVVTIGIEKATGGRVEYVDKKGYDNVDKVTGIKYEVKSLTKMFNDFGALSTDVILCNTQGDVKFTKTFDYLLCVQSDPREFAIAQFDWQTCYDNHFHSEGQFKLRRGLSVTKWICRDKTRVKQLEPVPLNIKKMLEDLF